MTRPLPPSKPHILQLELTVEALAVSNDVLDHLRSSIERLISQELSAIPPVQGVSARESSIVQLELFDDVTGEMIFG